MDTTYTTLRLVPVVIALVTASAAAEEPEFWKALLHGHAVEVALSEEVDWRSLAPKQLEAISPEAQRTPYWRSLVHLKDSYNMVELSYDALLPVAFLDEHFVFLNPSGPSRFRPNRLRGTVDLRVHHTGRELENRFDYGVVVGIVDRRPKRAGFVYRSQGSELPSVSEISLDPYEIVVNSAIGRGELAKDAPFSDRERELYQIAAQYAFEPDAKGEAYAFVEWVRHESGCDAILYSIVKLRPAPAIVASVMDFCDV